MAKKRRRAFRPDGEVRLSQMLSTYGAGAMVDFPNDAVLIGGLDFWKADTKNPQQVIEESRLRDDLAERLRQVGRTLSVEEAFRGPPVGDSSNAHPGAGVSALEFPRWFVCQNSSCRALVRAHEGLERKGNHYRHACDRGSPSRAVPVRHVIACKNGHIDEFPWVQFVHGKSGPCASPRLSLHEGKNGDFSEIQVRCACGAKRYLREARRPDVKLKCHGRRPWLGTEGNEDCDEDARLLVRTASNGYFAQVESALSIPDQGNTLWEAVQSVWDVAQAATNESWAALKTIPKVADALGEFDDEEVLACVARVTDGRRPERDPIRTAEFKQLVSQPLERPGDIPDDEVHFFARRLPRMEELPDVIENVFVVKKLREVRVQVGFTRIEPPTSNLQGEFDLGVNTAPLSLQEDWLPASEVWGEGIFIQLNEDKVHGWETSDALQPRVDELLEGFDTKMKDKEVKPAFPGVRFYMLHTLSHMLMTALSLECGYPASAIKERIYCAPHDDDAPMAGLLLMTGSASSEGTLGGLVDQARRLASHLHRALLDARLCSNDPVCASHSPRADLSERFLDGAACHGCLYVAETSCERFNGYLDRALVVKTLSHADYALFGDVE